MLKWIKTKWNQILRFWPSTHTKTLHLPTFVGGGGGSDQSGIKIPNFNRFSHLISTNDDQWTQPRQGEQIDILLGWFLTCAFLQSCQESVKGGASREMPCKMPNGWCQCWPLTSSFFNKTLQIPLKPLHVNCFPLTRCCTTFPLNRPTVTINISSRTIWFGNHVAQTSVSMRFVLIYCCGKGPRFEDLRCFFFYMPPGQKTLMTNPTCRVLFCSKWLLALRTWVTTPVHHNIVRFAGFSTTVCFVRKCQVFSEFAQKQTATNLQKHASGTHRDDKAGKSPAHAKALPLNSKESMVNANADNSPPGGPGAPPTSGGSHRFSSYHQVLLVVCALPFRYFVVIAERLTAWWQSQKAMKQKKGPSDHVVE